MLKIARAASISIFSTYFCSQALASEQYGITDALKDVYQTLNSARKAKSKADALADLAKNAPTYLQAVGKPVPAKEAGIAAEGGLKALSAGTTLAVGTKFGAAMARVIKSIAPVWGDNIRLTNSVDEKMGQAASGNLNHELEKNEADEIATNQRVGSNFQQSAIAAAVYPHDRQELSARIDSFISNTSTNFKSPSLETDPVPDDKSPDAEGAQQYLVSDGSLLTDDMACRFNIDFENSGSVLQGLNELISTAERYQVKDYVRRGPLSLTRVSNNGYDANFRMQYLGYSIDHWYVSADWTVEIKITLTDKIYLTVIDKYNTDAPQDNITLQRCDGENRQTAIETK